MRLAAIISEHMVLQRDKEIRIFGETENAAVICADIDGVTSREEAAGGHFVLTLPAHAAGGPFTLTITESDPENGAVRDEKKIGDIYFGEVWIDNGQSNIEFEIRNARGGAKELEEAASISKSLNERYGDRIEAFQNVVEIDIAPRGCSKGKGVNFLREYMKEQLGEFRLYGIGDSINDLPLLEASDVSYTFPYAPKEVQEKADKVVETIVDALEDSMRD